jgi:hypothetical protein
MVTAAAGTPRVQISDVRLAGLRRFNGVMGLLHLVQGVFMIAVSNATVYPVFTNFLGAQFVDGALRSPRAAAVFELRFGPAVALFLLISAVAHGYLATIGFERYKRDLRNGMNPVRFYEYALSSSLMIVLIGMLTGIWDLGAILLIFFLNAR